MPTPRAASALLATVAALLIGLMVYALMLGGQGLFFPRWGSDPQLVAVFYPDTSSWHDFRRAVMAVAERGDATIVERTAGIIRLRTKRSGREVRFQWYDEPGVLAARSSLRTLLESPAPPVAVVGSSNTTLTTALADELAEYSRERNGSTPGPLLVISSATAVDVPADGTSAASGATRPLLDIYPRALRFCLNNQRIADLVVSAASGIEAQEPRRAILVVDPGDPFSVDLVDCFVASLVRMQPKVEIVKRDWRPPSVNFPGAIQDDLSALLEARADERLNGQDVGVDWVLMTIQGSPARQLIQGLRGAPQADSLRLLSGDGIGRTTLVSYAGQLPFPMCVGVSSSSPLPAWLDTKSGLVGQTQAEIVTALIGAIDGQAPENDIFRAVQEIHLPATSPLAAGRSLAFKGRERSGDDVGEVLELVPGSETIRAHTARALRADAVKAGASAPGRTGSGQ